MKCPSCNKFAGLELGEPEVDVDVEVSSGAEAGQDSTAVISGNARIVRTSACCGDEMKEANFEIDASCDVPKEHVGEGHDISVEVSDSEGTERSENKDRHGRPIKNYRYMKTMIGVSCTFAVSCSCGQFSEDVSWSDEIQASAMDELV